MNTYQHRTQFVCRLIVEGMVAVAGLGMLTTLPVAAYEPAPPWQVAQGALYASSSGRFAIAFPTPPEVTSEDDDIEGEPIAIHTYQSLTAASQYMVAYADLPTGFLEQGEQGALDQLRDYVFDDIDLDALVGSEINVQLSNHPGRRYRYSNDDATIDLRLYLVDERAYLLIAADQNKTDVDRFISSFVLR
ncbi:MAG: hypothetical protein ACFB2W_07990 [Leptolyngbyaceae cyanobacterium]